jgi:hypothetical protein
MSNIEPILLTGEDRPGRRRSSEVSWSLKRCFVLLPVLQMMMLCEREVQRVFEKNKIRNYRIIIFEFSTQTQDG